MSPIEVSLIRAAHLFARLPEETVEALCTISALQTYPAKALVFLDGDPAAGMYVVSSGRIKICRVSLSGREQILTLVTPGQHFNIVPVFDGGPCPANAETITPSEVLYFPADTLRQLVAQHPALALALLRECCGHMRRLVNLVDDLTLHTVQGRLARMLVQTASSKIKTPLTQAEMAAQLGTVREMVGRSLKTFETLGLIEIQRGVIRVIDQPGLLAQADG